MAKETYQDRHDPDVPIDRPGRTIPEKAGTVETVDRTRPIAPAEPGVATYETTETHTFDLNDDRSHRSLGSIVSDLRDQFMLLLRQEVALVKKETSEKVSRVSRGAVSAGVGGAVAYTGLIFMLLAACVGLAVGIDEWLGIHAYWVSPLAIGLLTGLIGLIMYSSGKNTIKRESAVPEQTAASLKEDRQWARQQMTR